MSDAGKILAALGKSFNVAPLSYRIRERSTAIEDAETLDRVAELFLEAEFHDNSALPEGETIESYWRKRTRENYQVAAYIVDERRRMIEEASK